MLAKAVVNPEIPDAIIPNILKRLPSKSLFRFQIVCKTWHYIIDDYDFQSLHRCHSKSIPRWLGFEREPRKSTTKTWYSDECFASHQFEFCRLPTLKGFTSFGCCQIMGSCDGVILLWTWSEANDIVYGKNIMCLWNPSIGKYRAVDFPFKLLPMHSFRLYQKIGFGFVERNKDYKIVIICRSYPPHWDASVYVYSLTTGLWRLIPCKPNYEERRGYRALSQDGTYFNGACHWLYITSEGPIILCFNLHHENFRDINMPPQRDFTMLNYHRCTFIYKDMLALWHEIGDHRDRNRSEPTTHNVWVMKEYGKSDSWSPLFKVEYCECISVMVIGEYARGRLLLNIGHGNAVKAYDPHDKKYTDLLDMARVLVPYEESLTLI